MKEASGKTGWIELFRVSRCDIFNADTNANIAPVHEGALPKRTCPFASSQVLFFQMSTEGTKAFREMG
jgi:hypothetical protein